MNKTQDLREMLRVMLAQIAELAGFPDLTVAYAQVPERHSPKYIVFSIEELLKSDDRTACELEINCIDYGTDTGPCEDLADAIQAELDHNFILGDNVAFQMYTNKRNNVNQQDTKIIWRRLTFDLYLYERG